MLVRDQESREHELPGDSYLVPFWVVYSTPNKKQVITEKELHGSLPVGLQLEFGE